MTVRWAECLAVMVAVANVCSGDPSPLRLVISPIFDEIARSQMGAFVRRADEIYGDA